MRRICLVRQFSASPLLREACGLPIFLEFVRCLSVVLAFCLIPAAFAAEDVASEVVVGSDFRSAHDALVEAIESEGLVVSAVIPFNDMLARTADDLARASSPLVNAEIVQFCSSVLAWQLLEEEASQIALCPLSIAIYVRRTDPDKVTLAYRLPGNATPGRIRAEKLLTRVVHRSAELARLRW